MRRLNSYRGTHQDMTILFIFLGNCSNVFWLNSVFNGNKSRALINHKSFLDFFSVKLASSVENRSDTVND